MPHDNPPSAPSGSFGKQRDRASRRRSRLTVALLALVPLCLAGWLGWRTSTAQDGQGREKTHELMPRPPSEDGDAPSGDGASGAAKPGGGLPREAGRPSAEKPLAGRTVVIDPGHNPNNADHPDEIARAVGIGTAEKPCDTAGTATASGYTEAEFTLDLARRVRTALEKKGATVSFTQDGHRAYGPCVDERAEAGNRAEADAAVSLHADGAPAGNRGFHVIVPAAVREGAADTTAITDDSRRLGENLARSFRETTGSGPASYAGDGEGLDTRDDLGGLNLSKVPKVFLECGNMRDSREADRLTDPSWRGRAAQGVVTGITAFLEGKADR